MRCDPRKRCLWERVGLKNRDEADLGRWFDGLHEEVVHTVQDRTVAGVAERQKPNFRRREVDRRYHAMLLKSGQMLRSARRIIFSAPADSRVRGGVLQKQTVW